MTDRDKFEAWAKTEYEVNDFGQILIGGDDSVEYDVSAQDCSEEMFDAWQAATEQSQKEIEALQAREKVLVEAIRNCLDWANGRQAEWGTRAEKSFEFLEQALANVRGE